MAGEPASLFSVTFDPHAMSLLIAVNALAIALAVLLSARTYPSPISWSMVVFGVGKLMTASGFILIALRADIHPALSVICGNALGIAGLCSNLLAIQVLQSKAADYGVAAVLTAATVAGSAMFSLIQPDYQALRGVTSAIALIVCVRLSVELLVRYGGPGRAHIFAGILVALSCVVLALRILDTLRGGVPPDNGLASDGIEGLFFVTVYLAATLATLNFILMYNDAFNDELRRLVHIDSLTGVANRRRLFERGDEEVRRARRFHHPLTVLVLDIDHFKRINDGWGHAVRDLALTAGASACRAGLSDVDMVARLGGEEFVILLPETPALPGTEVGERLRGLIADLAFDCQPPLRVTVSVGIAELDEGEDFPAVLRRADEAMYQAKNAGRDRVLLAPALEPSGV